MDERRFFAGSGERATRPGETLVALFEYPDSVVSAGGFPLPSSGGSVSAARPSTLSEDELTKRFSELFPAEESSDHKAANESGSLSTTRAAGGRDHWSGIRANSYFDENSDEDGLGAGPASHSRQDCQGGLLGAAARGSAQAEEDRESLLARQCRQCQQAEERGRKDGFALGQNSAHAEAVVSIRGERERISGEVVRLLTSFAVDRKTYFDQMEEQAVGLSLAIAARILRREAHVDPLLLTSAVRVALGQLAGSTRVEVCVPAVESELWAQTLAHLPGLGLRPTVRGDPSLVAGECLLETGVGTLELGLWQQLQLIGREFFGDAQGRDGWESSSNKEVGQTQVEPSLGSPDRVEQQTSNELAADWLPERPNQ